MTTGTWDGVRISADTRSITDDTIDQGPCQKIFQKKGVYCAVAGDLGAAKKAALWLLGRKKNKPKLEDEEFEIILVSKDRQEYYDESLVALELPTPHAIGSGKQPALAAMLAGENGREAIRIAARIDPNTSVDYGLRSFKV